MRFIRMRRTIKGERTSLRPASHQNLDLLAGWFSDPEFVRWWGGTPLPRDEVAPKYTGDRSPTVESLIVEEDGRPVGYIQYWAGEDDASGGIDIVLTREAQGRGLGSEAAAALARHLRDDRGWRRITVDPAIENQRAIRAYRKAGFVEERHWPDHPDGPALLMVFGETA